MGALVQAGAIVSVLGDTRESIASAAGVAGIATSGCGWGITGATATGSGVAAGVSLRTEMKNVPKRPATAAAQQIKAITYRRFELTSPPHLWQCFARRRISPPHWLHLFIPPLVPSSFPESTKPPPPQRPPPRPTPTTPYATSAPASSHPPATPVPASRPPDARSAASSLPTLAVANGNLRLPPVFASVSECWRFYESRLSLKRKKLGSPMQTPRTEVRGAGSVAMSYSHEANPPRRLASSGAGVRHAASARTRSNCHALQ